MVLAGVVLVSCSSGKDSSTPPSTSPLLEQTTTSLPTTPVLATILSPEKSSVQGSGGRGMVVHLVFQAKDPGVLPAEFRLGGALPSPAPAAKPGHNPAFPGLVVTVSTTGPALGGSAANLANLFQIVSPSLQADGSVQVAAVWTNGQDSFGTDLDVTVVAFTVSGTAPDTVPQTPAELSPTSNLAQVSFHLSGASASSTTSTTAAKATSTTKSGSATTTTKAAASSAPATTTTTRATTTTAATVPATTTTTKLLGLIPFPPVP